MFYNIYQSTIGYNGWLKRYYKTFIFPEIQKKSDISLLDLGCGTGNIITKLPTYIHYTGIDYQRNYIDYCIKKYPQCTFICQNAIYDINLNRKFDIIISEALISNFDDKNIEKVFKNIIKLSNENTVIIISDLNFNKNNSKIENFLLKHERGNILRGREEYVKILSKYFKIKTIEEMDNIYRIPYKKIVFKLKILS